MKCVENCEGVTSSPHPIEYSYGLVKECFLKKTRWIFDHAWSKYMPPPSAWSITVQIWIIVLHNNLQVNTIFYAYGPLWKLDLKYMPPLCAWSITVQIWIIVLHNDLHDHWPNTSWPQTPHVTIYILLNRLYTFAKFEVDRLHFS